jgi:uncharacterized membrane protein
MEKINRPLLKENAKKALRGNFWMAVLLCFVATLLGGNWTGLGGTSNSGISSSFNSINNNNDINVNIENNDININDSNLNATRVMLDAITSAIQNTDKGQYFDFNYNPFQSAQQNIRAYIDSVCDYFNMTNDSLVQILLLGVALVLIIFLIIWVVVTVIQFAIGSFVGAPIGIGYRLYFMNNRLGKARFENLFAAFSGGKYMSIVKNLFATNIRIWGWSLLFYFPGLVKYYEYFFVRYIIAENPDISPARARELSRKMSDGHKWQIFVLELSFLGWIMVFVLEEIVLALISCGILAIPGVVLIYPVIAYMQATYAELYEERREYALMQGFAWSDELRGF